MKLREKVDRPWGRFFVIQDDNDYKIKIRGKSKKKLKKILKDI